VVCATGYNERVLAELPFTIADQIAAEYKPGAGVSTKAALRTLRDKELITQGVSRPILGEKGKLAGELHFYSSLNVDVVRLHRMGYEPAARKLVQAARRIERQKETRTIADGLMARPELAATGLHTAFSEMLATKRGDVLRSVTENTERHRREIGAADGVEAPTYAKIMKLYGDVAELKLENSEIIVPFPRSELLGAMLMVLVGATIALVREQLGPGITLLRTTGALDLGAAAGPAAAYPPARPLPEHREPVVLEGVLTAAATIPTPRRLAISGKK
jgi:hypothetical protein